MKARFNFFLLMKVKIKCMGKDDLARQQAEAFLQEFGKREQSMEHYYDHYEAVYALKAIVNTVSEFDQ